MTFTGPRIKSALLLAGFVLLAAVSGVLVGQSTWLILAPLLALVASAMLLLRPNLATGAVIIGSLAVFGVVELYLPKFRQIAWLIAALSFFIAGLALLRRVTSEVPPARYSSSAMFWAFVFFLACAASTLVNSGTSLAALTGVKGYFQAWGVLLALVWLNTSPRNLMRVGQFMFILALFQMPFVLHQFFVLVPLRSSDLDAARGLVAVDIVSGTFGGTLKGGGRGADLAVLCMIATAWALARYRQGLMSGRTLALALAWVLLPLSVTENKVVIVMLPLTAALVYSDKVRSSPVQSVLAVLIAMALSLAFLYVFSLLPGAHSTTVGSFNDYLDEFFSGKALTKGYGTNKLNRLTVYTFWLERMQMSGDWIRVLFGYGTGSANSFSAFAIDTLAATTYRGMGIGLTSISALLWDVGLVGTLAVLFMSAAVFRLSSRVLKDVAGTAYWPLVKMAQVGLVMCLVSFLLNATFTFDLPFQVMYMICCGIILGMARMPAQARTEPAAVAPVAVAAR